MILYSLYNYVHLVSTHLLTMPSRCIYSLLDVNQKNNLSVYSNEAFIVAKLFIDVLLRIGLN